MPLSIIAAKNKDERSNSVPTQHRHFAAIAAIIKELNGTMTIDDVQTVAEHFAGELRLTNPRFDTTRFLKACGL